MLNGVPTQEGLNILNSQLREQVRNFVLVGCNTHEDENLQEIINNAHTTTYEQIESYIFHRGECESIYYDENSVLTFEIELPISQDLSCYTYGVGLIAEENILLCLTPTPKIMPIRGVGGTFVVKVAIKGNAGEIIFSNNEITRREIDNIKISLQDRIAYDYEKRGAPTQTINPEKDNAKWLDTNTGVLYICKDNTIDNNIWVSIVDSLEEFKEQIRFFDYMEQTNPTNAINPTRDCATWLNTKTGGVFVCVDKTQNNNIWATQGKYIGGVFNSFGAKDPTNEEGNIYINIATRNIFVKEDEQWIKIHSISLKEEMPEEYNDYILYCVQNTMYYKGRIVLTLDYLLQAPPQKDMNPTKEFALALDTSNGVFYICTDNTENKNVWDCMVLQSLETANVATPPVANIIKSSTPNSQLPLIGFGGGIPSDRALLRLGLERLPGSLDPESIEWSQYVHSKTGSVMCYTPKMYHKYSFEGGEPYYGLKVELSPTKKEGFVLHRAFYNAGEVIEGFFMDKYRCTVKDGVAASLRNGIPVGMASATQGDYYKHFHFSACNANGVNPTDTLEGAINAAKSRGAEFFLTPVFMRTWYLTLMLAKYQKAHLLGNAKQHIAWCDKEPHAVRGANHRLNDGIDTQVNYISNNWEQVSAKTGGVFGELNLKKISILGDGCSPCDFNTRGYEILLGGSSKTWHQGIFKKNIDLRTINTANAFNEENFFFFSINNGGNMYFGDGNQEILHCSNNEESDEYYADCAFYPKYQNQKYTSSNGLIKDYISSGGNGNTMVITNNENWRSLFNLNWHSYKTNGIGWHCFRASALGEQI